MRYIPSFLSYAAALSCVTLLGAGCAQTQPTIYPKPDPTPATTPSPVRDVCDPQNSICARGWLVNSVVSSPVVASGTAIAFESTFQWKLLRPIGQLISEGTLTATAPDIGLPGTFDLSQAITIPLGYTTGTLQFYESSAKDGTPIHILNIPVNF